MRVCHLDTCPVGVATQNPELRKRFSGRPEFVVTFFEYIAEEIRELLAALGFRSLDEVIGHPELLDVTDAVGHWKARGLDLSPILETPSVDPHEPRHCVTSQDHGLDRALDQQLIEACQPALLDARSVQLSVPIRNVNRTVGTLLGAEVTRRYGGEGLPEGTVDISFTGSAGQSFGAFVPRGVTLRLEGDANDYLGKGLSGGRLIVRPPRDVPESFVAEQQIIAGNVILYGATAGEAFIRGVVGERFAVRNSGATTVVEGVGDHGCEYMTGGRVAVLGPTGRNFGAGMSGGIAYVWDPHGTFGANLNGEMVDLEDCEEDEVLWLAEILEQHSAETGSPVAARILAGWPRAAAQFVKVMPRDYKRVLRAVRDAEATGVPVEDAIMAASRG
jgi:glutamate synthase (NADPH/NADH) large chain